MPHIIIEHKTHRDVGPLTKALHEAAKSLEALPVGGLRTRDYPCDNALIGDGTADFEFCYVTVRLGAGRSDEVKQEIGDTLFAVLTNWAEPTYAENQPLSLGLEIQDIAPGSTWKKNNIHQILKDRT